MNNYVINVTEIIETKKYIIIAENGVTNAQFSVIQIL